MRVSPAWAEAGVMLTAAMLGAEFPTDTLADTWVPVSVPSKGVTPQATVSPVVKVPADRVLEAPAETPLTVQA